LFAVQPFGHIPTDMIVRLQFHIIVPCNEINLSRTSGATVKSTVTITTDTNGEIIKIQRNSETSVQKAYGELTITDNWSKFTLAINGIDPLTGSVFRSVTRQVQFNPFKITDDATCNIVTRADLVEVVKCYRAMPGWGSYDTRMDFNNNYRVDIADLSTVASHM
jgi:hypothetical protein